MKNVLMVCSANVDRSPTAEAVAKQLGWEHVRSGGTLHSARNPLSEELILWSELIIVMEEHHRQTLLDRFSDALAGRAIIVLGIPDNYVFMEERLAKLLGEQLKAIEGNVHRDG